MKKLGNISYSLLAVTLILSLVACGNSANIVEDEQAITDEIEQVEPEETIEPFETEEPDEQKELEDKPLFEDSDWRSLTLVLDDTIINYPWNLSDFIDKGWSIDETMYEANGGEDWKIGPFIYTKPLIILHKDGYDNLIVGLSNQTESDVYVLESQVYTLQLNQNTTENIINLKIPNGVTLGTNIENVLELYSEEYLLSRPEELTSGHYIYKFDEDVYSRSIDLEIDDNLVITNIMITGSLRERDI